MHERALVIERAIALGEIKETKTGAARTVRLLAPLAADLAEWRLASGKPNQHVLVFPNRAGGAWSDFDWRNWRKRVFATATLAIGLKDVRPYDLRHSFVSLLLAEGASVVDEELVGAERQAAEDLIRRARGELVPLPYPQEAGTARSRRAKSRQLQELRGEPTRGFEPRTPSLRAMW